jgi:hypothetical protein
MVRRKRSRVNVGKRIPQFGQRLPQTVARLLVAAVAPEQIGELAALMGSATRQCEVGE